MDSRDQQLCWVEIDDLLKNEPFPPRRQERPSEDLVSSTRIHGTISPVFARPTSAGLQLVCGCRRVQAARAAGVRRVPCLVRSLEDSEAIRCYLAENDCRRELDDEQLGEVLDRLKRLRDAGEVEALPARDGRVDAAVSVDIEEEKTLVLKPGDVGEVPGRFTTGRCIEESSSGNQLAAGSRVANADTLPTAGAEGKGPARWEVVDLVEWTREFFRQTRVQRKVVLVVARAIADELIGIQDDTRPLQPSDVYRERETTWLVPHSVLVASLNLALAPAGAGSHERRLYALAGLLHDIGMIFFEGKDLLTTTRELNFEQRAELRRHSWLGHALLSDLPAEFADVAFAARDHHERADGGGYPQGLRGDAICPVARVTAITDVYAALVGPRPHRSCMGSTEALECLVRNHGFSGCDAELASRLNRLLRVGDSEQVVAESASRLEGVDCVVESTSSVPEIY